MEPLSDSFSKKKILFCHVHFFIKFQFFCSPRQKNWIFIAFACETKIAWEPKKKKSAQWFRMSSETTSWSDIFLCTFRWNSIHQFRWMFMMAMHDCGACLHDKSTFIFPSQLSHEMFFQHNWASFWISLKPLKNYFSAALWSKYFFFLKWEMMYEKCHNNSSIDITTAIIVQRIMEFYWIIESNWILKTIFYPFFSHLSGLDLDIFRSVKCDNKFSIALQFDTENTPNVTIEINQMECNCGTKGFFFFSLTHRSWSLKSWQQNFNQYLKPLF